MHLIVQASSDNVHTSVRCLWYFTIRVLTLNGSSGPFMFGLRVVGLVWSILGVRDLEGTFHNCLFYLLPLFQGMFFHSWALFLGKAHSGLVLVQGIMLT